MILSAIFGAATLILFVLWTLPSLALSGVFSYVLARGLTRRLEAVFALLPELRDLAPRRAAGLSGGQGKMVALGRALMIGTRAVLLTSSGCAAASSAASTESRA